MNFVVDPVENALAEDIGSGDITSEFLVPEDHHSRARIFAKEIAIVAGTRAAQAVFEKVDQQVAIRILRSDGQPVNAGDTVLEIVGRTRSILTGERVALNFIQRLSGIATITRKFVDAVAGTGVQILDTTIKQQLATPGVNSVAIFGLSQSADISSLEMINLANPTLNPNPPTANQLGFTLTGNQMNPNGGFFARFPGFGGQPLQFPALGLTLYGATPSTTIYPTNIFSLEYDGWADFPQYPINFVSDLNAVLGIAFVHGMYPSVNPSLLPANDLILLPGSTANPAPGGVAATNTNYYMMTPTNNLPLLAPLRLIPGIGNPLADLLQPDLTTIVNLGYGNPDFGWNQGPANVQTYFGLFPHVSQALIAQDLIAGAHQGTAAFVSDMHAEAAGVSLSSVSHSLTSMAGTGAADVHALTHTLSSSSPASIIADIQGAVTNFANGISGTTANIYGALLPTADIVNTLITVMPAYDVNLFLSGIQQAIDGNVLGGLQYALVAPIAANTAFVTLASLIELDVILNAFGLSL